MDFISGIWDHSIADMIMWWCPQKKSTIFNFKFAIIAAHMHIFLYNYLFSYTENGTNQCLQCTFAFMLKIKSIFVNKKMQRSLCSFTQVMLCSVHSVDFKIFCPTMKRPFLGFTQFQLISQDQLKDMQLQPLQVMIIIVCTVNITMSQMNVSFR